MLAFVGLGNPGIEYEHTRHNAGFDTVDILAHEASVSYWKTICGALVGIGKLKGAQGEEEVLFAKPQSFMNLSGGPVVRICKEYDIAPENLVVIHDELDIPPLSVRVKKGGGHAGHNGLRSIIEKLGSRDFLRIRVGIGRPPGRMKVADFVLQVPKRETKDEFEATCKKAADAGLSLLVNGLEKTQSLYNV